MTWDWGYALEITPVLLGGLLVTVEVSVLASAIAMALGLAVAIIRFARIPHASRALAAIVDFVRGTPLLVQIYFVFYALPAFGLAFSAIVTGVVTLGVNYAAYTAEVYRAGIENVPKGQWDAVAALGLSRRRAWFRIILPQALRGTLPSLGNYVISMFKDSAILTVIAVPELLNRALGIANSSYRYLEPMLLVGLLFLGVSYPAAKGVRWLERRLATNERGAV